MDIRKPFFKSVFAASSLVFVCALASNARADCSCTGMTVRHAVSSTTTVCSNTNFKDFVKSKECTRTVGTVANGCDTYAFHYACENNVNTQELSAKEPTQKTGFGIEAAVTGTPTDCKFGHSLQQQIYGNGIKDPNSELHDNPPAGDVTVDAWKATIETAPGLMPDIGATASGRNRFGADNYSNAAATDVLIEASPGRIRWWDNPDQTKKDDPEVASWTFRYFSYAIGKGAGAKSCGCVFRIDVQWGGAKAPNTTYALDPDSPGASACTF